MISSSVILPPFFFCLSAALEEASASGAGSGSITDLVYTCRNTPKKTFHKGCVSELCLFILNWPKVKPEKEKKKGSPILCVRAVVPQLEVVCRHRRRHLHPCPLTGGPLYPACLAETTNVQRLNSISVRIYVTKIEST